MTPGRSSEDKKSWVYAARRAGMTPGRSSDFWVHAARRAEMTPGRSSDGIGAGPKQTMCLEKSSLIIRMTYVTSIHKSTITSTISRSEKIRHRICVVVYILFVIPDLRAIPFSLLCTLYCRPDLFLSILRLMMRVSLSNMIMLLALRHSMITAAYTRTIASTRMEKRSFSRLMTLADDSEFDSFTSKVVFMFPGQGAQFMGMCSGVVKDVPRAAQLFDKASSILGYDLLEVCTNGPKESLDSTVISQPAIFVASMAAVEKMKQEMGDEIVNSATCAMGLSLGEYSALCFAEAISFEDGVRITKLRGEAMQKASDSCDSGMVSVIGLDKTKVNDLCEMASSRSGSKVQIANYLCNGNYAVSGASTACQAVTELAKPEFKARMTVKLAVAGAFHTDFMSPAVDALKKVLEKVEISKPRIPVISNVDAKPHSDPAVIKQLLATQVTSPVLWENTIDLVLNRGFEQAYELGPGKVTTGILKRFDKRATITNVEV